MHALRESWHRIIRTIKKDHKAALVDADRRLLAAAAKGSCRGIRSAVRGCADTDARNTKCETALILAAAGCHMRAVRLLIKLKADPFAVAQDDFTARGRAEKAGRGKMAAVLKAYEAEWAAAHSEPDETFD